MEFPELLFEEEQAYRTACRQVTAFFYANENSLSDVSAIGREIKCCYTALEPFFHDYTESICHECATPCCVNRHGFPDFEDLVLFQAMGISIPEYNFHVIDTDICQFLTKDGCSLTRCMRSYRCTWYFCDYVLDEFEHSHRIMFGKFDSAMSRLGDKRGMLLRQFKHLWFENRERPQPLGLSKNNLPISHLIFRPS